MSKINIFISHKHEDAETAGLLKKKLELFGGAKIECFFSEKIQHGADWFDTIKANLRETKILILIFTSSNYSWDWPLYEVGLATRLDDLDSCKIITLHPPGAVPPEPIKHLQAVEATQLGIKEFLHSLLCTDEITGIDPPLNARLADTDDLDETAKQISSKFCSVVPWENCFTNFLWVITNGGKLEKEEIPLEARIDSKSTALGMFRLAPNKPDGQDWTWGEILERIESPDEERWIKELDERFFWASRGENLKETRGLFECRETGRIHRPLLHKVSVTEDGSMRFEVIFVRHYELAE